MNSQDKNDIKIAGTVIGALGAVIAAIGALAKENKNGQTSSR
jgi:hypothetical protein